MDPNVPFFYKLLENLQSDHPDSERFIEQHLQEARAVRPTKKNKNTHGSSSASPTPLLSQNGKPKQTGPVIAPVTSKKVTTTKPIPSNANAVNPLKRRINEVAGNGADKQPKKTKMFNAKVEVITPNGTNGN